jgi:membrane fusion protein (multidrug efflux system)
MRRRWLVRGIVVLAVGGLAAAVVSRGLNSESSPFGKKRKPPEVTLEFAAHEVVAPVMTPLPGLVEFSGPLVAPNTAIVRAKAPGTLLVLHVGEGSRVRAGQALGTIDLADLNSRVAERNAQLDSARAQLAQAERQHAVNKGLAEQKFISAHALESSRISLEAAQAQLQAARAQLQSMRVGLREAALIAPIAGLVSKRHVVPGEKLSLEQSVITIVDLAKLELAGNVGTHDVSLLTPGMPVEVRVEGVTQPVAGSIARIAPAAEAGTRSIGVTIELDNPKESYRAGQYALARVALPDSTPRLTVPASAIVVVTGEDHVWVIDNGVLVRRSVTTGRRDARHGRVEVVQGLRIDAQVLAARYDNLKEGTRAIVVRNPAPAAGLNGATPATATR